MDKYLVFRLEKPMYENEPHRDQTVVPCFELIREISNWERESVELYAERYSKDHNLRTLVLKGSVFGY